MSDQLSQCRKISLSEQNQYVIGRSLSEMPKLALQRMAASRFLLESTRHAPLNSDTTAMICQGKFDHWFTELLSQF